MDKFGGIDLQSNAYLAQMTDSGASDLNVLYKSLGGAGQLCNK